MTQSKIEKRGDAIRYGDSDLALWFLKRGFDPEARDSKGRSALWWAAACRKSNVIRALVQKGAALPDGVLMGPVKAGAEGLSAYWCSVALTSTVSPATTARYRSNTSNRSC